MCLSYIYVLDVVLWLLDTKSVISASKYFVS
jgi:hypothetical protein